MERPIYIVDAFTSEAFKGNPAGVCLLDKDSTGGVDATSAAEMNLSETAFLVPRAEGDGYHLRWFTPAVKCRCADMRRWRAPTLCLRPASSRPILKRAFTH